MPIKIDDIIEDIIDLYDTIKEEQSHVFYDLGKVIDAARLTIDDILQFYNLPPIKTRFPIKKDTHGSFSIYDNCLEISEKLLDFRNYNTSYDFDKNFVKLLHTLFHEPRHYMQFLYLSNKLPEISQDDVLYNLSKEEKAEFLQELKNPNNQPIFYHSQFHEQDAVEFALEKIEEIITLINEQNIKKSLLNGLGYERQEFNEEYNKRDEAVEKKGYKYHELDKKNKLSVVEITNDELLRRMVAEFLPINKCIIEQNVLKLNGLKSETIGLKNYSITLSNNNSNWFVNIKNKTGEEIKAKISNKECCIYETLLYDDSNKSLMAYKKLIEILKNIVNKYNEKNNSQVNKYIFAPMPIFTEKQRISFMKKFAIICGFSENKTEGVFVNINYSSSNIQLLNPYKKEVDTELSKMNIDNLDKKIDHYKNINAALIKSESITKKDGDMNR